MSRNSHRPSRKKQLSKLAQSIATISGLNPGLTMVVGQYSEMTLYVHAAIVQALAKQSADLPIPMPDCKSVICYFRNTPRKLEQLRSVHKLLGLSARTANNFKFVYRETSRELDWTSPAAAATLSLGREDREGCSIVLQQPAGTTPDIEGLLHLRRAAEAADAYVILLCPDVAHDAKISSIPNELFVATPCEPNPGFDEAFVLSCPELASPLIPGGGKVLCCVRLGNDGLEAEITPYVADDLRTRLMAILKAVGWNLERIGKTVGLDKSNVSRKLCFISSSVPRGWGDVMLAEWLEACGLNLTDDELASEGEPEDDDDLDSLDVTKFVASASRNKRNSRNKNEIPKRKQR